MNTGPVDTNSDSSRPQQGYRRILQSMKHMTDVSAEAMRDFLPVSIQSVLMDKDTRTDANVRHYTEEWSAKATLSDGVTAHFRLLAGRDRELLQHGYAHLSEESRYQRFMTSLEELPEHYLDHLTAMDNEDHLAIVALRIDELGREIDGLGVVRYFRDRDQPNSAEIAITIVDELQGSGLGSMLFALCGAAAWERNVDRLHAELLPGNDAMRGLARRFGGTLQNSETGLETWVVPIGADE